MRYVDSQLDVSVERMIALCRFCSSEAAEQRARAAMLVEELRCAGFSAGVRDSPSVPIVVGHARSSPGPTVLFCGHYDAWPVGLSHEKRRSTVALSASGVAADRCNDDQSIQLMAFVEACRAWRAVTGQLPTPVSMLVVGGRRSGSARLKSILRMYADELNADIGLAPAVRISAHAAPIIYGTLRGLCCEEFTIVPAHSDPCRGLSADPAQIIARIIGDLQRPFGCIAVPGFYDSVDPALRASCALELSLPGRGHGSDQVQAVSPGPACGIDGGRGDRHHGSLRRRFSPRAVARLSFHLVCDQDPHAICLAFRDFARARVPLDGRIEFAAGTSLRPVRFTLSHPAFAKTRDALTAEWRCQTDHLCGDAAPVIHALREALGIEVIVTSFPKKNGFCRAPYGTPEPASYRLSIRSWARILDALSR